MHKSKSAILAIFQTGQRSLWQKFLDFMHAFKSAILAEWKNCQNGTFEPVHEIQKNFGQKTSFEAL